MTDWTIYCGDNLVYNRKVIDDNLVRTYEVTEPVLTETCKSFGSLTFSAVDGTAAASYMEKLYPHTKLYKNGTLYWKGRLLSDTPDIYGKHKYYVEDFLGVLNDSVCRPYEFTGTPAEFLTKLINEHNEQVLAHQRFKSVSCDVPADASTGNIVRSSESYASTWSVINEKLLKPLGGYIWVSYNASEEAILHYSKNARDASTQVIQLGENLASVSIKNDAESFYTACVPLGKQDEETKDYLTIASVNSGKDYLINTAMANIYGVIFAPIDMTTWEDVTLPENLLSKANAWMQYESAKAVQEINLTAVDLGGVDSEMFFWLDSVRVVVPSRNLDSSFVIESIKRQLDNPASVKISLNYSGKQITGMSAASASANAKVIKEIKSDYTTSKEIALLKEEIVRQATYIEQKANEIVLSALEEYTKTTELGDTEAFQTLESSIRSQLSVLADSISVQFQSISNRVTQLGQETSAEFAQYSTWFRFIAKTSEHEEGLVIGESTSPIQMKLENDVLYFCTDPENVTRQTAIAYFASGALTVEYINVHNLTIGYEGLWMDVRIAGTGANAGILFSGRSS